MRFATLFLAATLCAQPTASSLYQQAIQAASVADAIRLLRLSIAAEPTFEARYRLGVALNQEKRYDDAMAELREAFALTRPDQLADRAHVLFRRAEAAEGLGHLLDAKRLVEMSIGYEDHPRVQAKLVDLQNRLASEVIPTDEIREAAEQVAKDFDIQRKPSVDVWVNFTLGSAEMTPQGRAQAEALAPALLTPFLQKYRFVVVGHTDTTGTNAINDPLSERRARAVLGFLQSKGMPVKRATAEGRGSREPLRQGTAAADHAVNRRVQVMLVRYE